ncbi:MAG: hypothetical protein PHI27_00015 [Eubacteriales bacterium]|nr:hypothetical protein [Eubacteriales bacterium]MDD3880628.1 hypothetical protein [Eubacteriales bacterium]MDD4513534.1 hypothetical protein [Eubacteriales bacterium]
MGFCYNHIVNKQTAGGAYGGAVDYTSPRRGGFCAYIGQNRAERKRAYLQNAKGYAAFRALRRSVLLCAFAAFSLQRMDKQHVGEAYMRARFWHIRGVSWIQNIRVLQPHLWR